jgi:hypothetical protein
MSALQGQSSGSLDFTFGFGLRTSIFSIPAASIHVSLARMLSHELVNFIRLHFTGADFIAPRSITTSVCDQAMQPHIRTFKLTGKIAQPSYVREAAKNASRSRWRRLQVAESSLCYTIDTLSRVLGLQQSVPPSDLSRNSDSTPFF